MKDKIVARNALFFAILMTVVAVSPYAEGGGRRSPRPTFYEWGIGILVHTHRSLESEILNFASDTLEVYTSPGGFRLGVMYPDTRMNRYYQVSFSYDSAKGAPIMTDPNDSREINYEGKCFKYYDSVSGYVEVLRHTLGAQGSGWVKVSEMEAIQLKPMLWADFILSRHPLTTFFNWSGIGLNLRSEPSVNSELLETIEPGPNRILLTGERSGKWFQVKVSDQGLGIAPDTSKFNWTAGWIKAINDRGMPNIWFATRGC